MRVRSEIVNWKVGRIRIDKHQRHESWKMESTSENQMLLSFALKSDRRLSCTMDFARRVDGWQSADGIRWSQSAHCSFPSS